MYVSNITTSRLPVLHYIQENSHLFIPSHLELVPCLQISVTRDGVTYLHSQRDRICNKVMNSLDKIAILPSFSVVPSILQNTKWFGRWHVIEPLVE